MLIPWRVHPPKLRMDTQNDAIFERRYNLKAPSFLVSMLDFGGVVREKYWNWYIYQGGVGISISTMAEKFSTPWNFGVG